MNTKNKENQKNKVQRTRQEHGPKKQSQNLTVHQDHEHPETRLTR
jgi:hypothetical protein